MKKENSSSYDKLSAIAQTNKVKTTKANPHGQQGKY